MTGDERRKKLIELLCNRSKAMSGEELSSILNVSRQVIVQDIALVRAGNYEIISTNRGYILKRESKVQRIFKVYHSDVDTQRELYTIVDLGGCVIDVFVYHRIYGIISAKLNIHSRSDVHKFMEGIKTGRSSPLKNITDGYHYHTVTAENKETLDMIENALGKQGFLAELTPFEPEIIKDYMKK